MSFKSYSKRLIIGAILTAAALSVGHVGSAQTVTNVDANQEGKVIAITYDLKEKSTVKVYCSDDGGKNRTEIPAAYLTGDIGKNVSPGKNRKVLWHVLDQYPNQAFQRENLFFIVDGRIIPRFFAMLNLGYALDSGLNGGVSFGQLGKIGWYGKGVSTFSLPKSTEYECDAEGLIDGILPAYSGNASTFKAYAVAGATFKVYGPLYMNAGLGFGARVYAWETNEGKWVKNIPGSYKGLVIDAGVILNFNSILVSAGITLLNFKPDIGFGIGYCF